MHIVVVGMNHKTAAVEERERVSLSEESLEHVLTQLRGTRTVMESVVLSTCNRTEMYALVSSARAGQDFLLTILAGRANITKAEMATHTYFLQGEEAVAHSMRVASGLDSLVVGETQILGQMRDAFQVAFEAGNTGAMFNRMFREVLHVGKRAQSDTDVGQNPVSVSYAAVQLARKVVGDMSTRTVLVIGAGHMGVLALRHFQAQGAGRLVVANRTTHRAVDIAEQVGAQVISLADVETMLVEADVIVTATGAPGHLISAASVEEAMKRRKSRPIVFLDIAMPRDIDPQSGQIPGVYLYDVDALDGVVEANLRERTRQSAIVEDIIRGGVETFSNWLTEQEVVPLIAALRSKGTAIQQEVMASIVRKIPELSTRDQKILNKHTMSIVNQLLRDPIQNVKELAIASGDATYVTMFAQLFGIDPVALSSEPTVGSVGDVTPSTVTFVELFQRLLGEDSDDVQGRRALHPVLR